MASDPYKDLPSLTSLQQKIDKAAGDKSGQDQSNSQARAGMSQAMKLSTELLAGVLVGGFLGYHLDNWLDTSPLLLIGCFFLGAAAGFRNIMRSAAAKTPGDDETKKK